MDLLLLYAIQFSVEHLKLNKVEKTSTSWSKVRSAQ
jgi:hypothetical protein